MVRTSLFIAAMTLSCSVTFSGSASAHHPTPPGSGGLLPRGRVGLEVRSAEFAPAGGGHWQLAALRLEHAFFQRLSLSLALPVAYVDYADGHRAAGPADAEIAASVLAWCSSDELVALVPGLAVEVPTGDVDVGLGDGHVMGSLSLAVAMTPHEAVELSLFASDHFALNEGSAPPSPPDEPEATAAHVGSDRAAPDGGARTIHRAGSVIAPHSDHELWLRFGAVFTPDPPLFVMAATELILMLEEADALGPVSIEGGVGVVASDALRFALRLTVPVAGQRRLFWQGALGAEVAF